MKNLLSVFVALVAMLALLVTAQVQAETFDLTTGTGYGWRDAGKTFVLEGEVDFSVNEAAQNDIFKLVSIKAPAYVHYVSWEVVTAATNTLTFGVGDSASATLYGAAQNGATNTTKSVSKVTATVTTTGDAQTNLAATVVMPGKLYTADNDIRITANHATDTGKVKVKVIVSSLE
jgi:hypothetical protein